MIYRTTSYRSPAAYGYGSYRPCPPAPAPDPGHGGIWPLGNHPAFSTPLTGDTAVIGCHFNPAGFITPRRNMATWLDWLWGCGAPVFMAELAFNAQPFVFQPSRRILQLRSGSEGIMFQKECLLNLVEKIVPARFTKILAIDADVLLSHGHWLSSASVLLDRVPAMQPFSTAIWLERDRTEQRRCPASCFSAVNHAPLTDIYQHGHMGFAWGVRRDFFTAVGGFPDSLITGSGDVATMLGMCALQDTPGIWKKISYMPEAARAWMLRASQWTEGRVDTVPSDARHLWHGSWQDRKYWDRHEALKCVSFAQDVRRNADGLNVWTDEALTAKPHAVQAIADMFHDRREDG